MADGYWRASSVGLTSISNELIVRFSAFLQKVSPNSIIKMRTYTSGKRTHPAFCVYINNRKMTRLFTSKLIPYLSGRIDGDGHYDLKHRSGLELLTAMSLMQIEIYN